MVHAGLPRSVGFNCVRLHHAFAVDFRAVRCFPALHPFGYIPLCLLPQSLQLSLWPLDPHLHLGQWPLRIQCDFLDPQHRFTSSPLCLCHGLPLHRCRCLLSTPWWCVFPSRHRLLPPAPQPWSTVLAVAWVITYLSLFKAIHWIIPPSPPWTFRSIPLPDSQSPSEPPPPPFICWCEVAPFWEGA